MNTIIQGIKILFLSLFFLLSSCEKVIQLDLNSSSEQIVIVGNVYNEPGPYQVSLTRSIDFDKPNDFPPVSGALVVISDNLGVIDTLIEEGAGIYKTTHIQGVSGGTYSLKVQTNGKTYEAQSYLPPHVQIDSIFKNNSMASMGFPPMITMRFSNPIDQTLYYRVITFIDGVRTTTSIVDGSIYGNKPINLMLFSQELTEAPPESNLRFELHTIDKAVFEYIRTAGQNNPMSVSPSNPVSNISNGALGYFSASSVSVEEKKAR